MNTKLRAVVCLFLASTFAVGQTPTQTTPQNQTEVLRIDTQLVQTDVMVFDKSGKFVRDLKREDFELKIDGKPKPIDFFETVSAGSENEEVQLAAARGSTRGGGVGAKPLDRGRVVYFYVDDVHLDLASLNASKKVITRFIENDMGQNDEAAVASTTGQIGFLQQLTDNKTVLRAAVERLSYKNYNISTFEEPRMTEYQALLVDRSHRDITDYFVDETLKQNPGLTRETAHSIVTARARTILQQAAVATTNTLSGLDVLVRSAFKQPGRKLVFLLSGGFLLDTRNSSSMDRLRRITSAAARSGVVIYSMDARGLVTLLADASSSSQIDVTGRLQRSITGELSESQDLMHALAHDTGGKLIANTNDLRPGLRRALDETATYYLLAWKPEGDATAAKFRKLEVKIAGRPELTVQVRRGFYDVEPDGPPQQAKKVDNKAAANPAESELRKVLGEAYPNRGIPISLKLNYVDDAAKGALLSAAMEIPSQHVSFVTVNGKQSAVLNLAGSFFNDKGQVGATFNKRIVVEVAEDGLPSDAGIVYKYHVFLKPGLYQVRMAARDEKTGQAGSAHSWIEIPDLAKGQFALSSLLVGTRVGNILQPTPTDTADDRILPSVSHRFARTDFLRFVVFVYNATPTPTDAKPNLAVQVQLVRDEQPVVTAPLKQILTEGVQDLKRVPYAAEISLADLASGRYQLHVSVVDRVAKRSAAQSVRFDIR